MSTKNKKPRLLAVLVTDQESNPATLLADYFRELHTITCRLESVGSDGLPINEW